jgi:hypothetical protein
VGRGRGWWRIALAALLCCVGLVAGAEGNGAEAAPRPRITWTFEPPILPVDNCPKAAYGERNEYFSVDVCPGKEVVVNGTFTPSQDVVVPRLILQTPSGARIMKAEPLAPLGTVIQADQTVAFRVVIAPPPGYRNVKASGRLYVADRNSVLVPPLFIQVTILHPTPEERALTPVVIPTNHIRMLADRLNIKQLTVTNGTNVTFTNLHTETHRITGALCAIATGPVCDPQPIVPGTCNEQPGAALVACIDSGPVEPHGTFTVRLTRPISTLPMRYQMDDQLGGYTGCVQQVGPNQGRHLCYLTVK